MTISTTTLKNAARAIGYDLWSDPDGSHYLVDYDGVKLKRWDPENSSADSFELMIVLHLDANVNYGKVDVFGGEDWITETFEDGGDGISATRSAIVRAAASIGSALCQS